MTDVGGGPAPRRALAPAAGVAAVLVLTSGCGSAVTSVRLEHSMDTTVANLFVLQQQRLEAPAVSAASLATQASCYRSSPSGPRTGAGDDWQCSVDYTTAQGPATARFDVQVKPDGCYKADGTPFNVGQAMLSDQRTGAAVTNPLFEFDACFDTSAGAR